MRHIFTLLLAASIGTALAQESKQPEKPAAPQETGQAKTEAAKPEAAQPEAAEPAGPVTGTIDFGYRWVGDVGGDFNTYRSVVNLGEGPKLFGVDLSFRPTGVRLFDELNVRANSWGGEPYSTARLDARRDGVYRVRFDYRDMAYFNFLPSFANPFREQGILLTERAFDMFRRTADFDLELLPGKRIVPFFSYQRYGGRGRGVTNFVLTSNEYPVPTTFDDHSDNFRGGVRFEMNRFHVTLEQGGVKYSDNQVVTASGPPGNTGNLQIPFQGQRLVLQTGQQSYAVSGDSLYTRAAFTANPVNWADLYGQFLYSRPGTDVTFRQENAGTFFSFTLPGFYLGQQLLASSRARQPHPSGNFSAEIRPVRGMRITQVWMTDRLHTAASAFLTEQLSLSGRQLTPEILSEASRLVMNYSQQEIQVLQDVLPWLTVRSGYRHLTGNAEVPAGLIAETIGLPRETGELRQMILLIGASFRVRDRVSANFDFEDSGGDKSYFRTSLNDYTRMRAQARLTPIKSLQVTAKFTVLDNQNNRAGSDYDFLSRDNSLSLYFTPFDGKWVNVLADYSRATLRSEISFRPPDAPNQPELSRYRENAHIGTLLVDLGSGITRTGQPKVSVGGTFYRSQGTRPSRFYQPLARVAVPLWKHLDWNAEWRWYGLTQPTYLFEGFRAHQFVTGFRIKM